MRRRATIDVAALHANARSLHLQRRILDVRADAYGHGLAVLAPVLAELAPSSLLVSPELGADALAALEAAGLVPVKRVDAGDHLVGPELFGLTDRALAPVLTVTAEVLALKRVCAGEGVSYGYHYRAERDTTLALVGIGYAHGAVRRASGRCPMLVGGAQHRIVGSISMDQCSVDLDGGTAELGSDAVLFGDPATGAPHVLDWAAATGIPAPAITARLAPLVERNLA